LLFVIAAGPRRKVGDARYSEQRDVSRVPAFGGIADILPAGGDVRF
jgi:hypothetical protein